MHTFSTVNCADMRPKTRAVRAGFRFLVWPAMQTGPGCATERCFYPACAEPSFIPEQARRYEQHGSPDHPARQAMAHQAKSDVAHSSGCYDRQLRDKMGFHSREPPRNPCSNPLRWLLRSSCRQGRRRRTSRIEPVSGGPIWRGRPHYDPPKGYRADYVGVPAITADQVFDGMD